MKLFTKSIILIAFLTLGYSLSSTAQCLEFAKVKGFAKLDTSKYIPDGRLNSITLSEGDNVDVYKPFFRGRKYKVVVVGQESLKKVDFQVVNFQRQVIFDSKKGNTNNSWEFESEKNQNLIIHVDIPKGAEGGNPKTGCVAVVVGFAQK